MKTIKVMSIENGYILTINDEQYLSGVFCYKDATNKQAILDAEYLGCKVVLTN